MSFLAVAFISAHSSAMQNSVEEMHRRAVSLAREARSAEAISIFQSLLEETNWEEEIFHDYVLALFWAGRFGDVLALSDRIELEAAPVHIINAFAVSARHLNDFYEARSFYGELLARQPNNLNAAIELWKAEAQTGDPFLATQSLESLVPQNEMSIPLMLALAEVAAMREDETDERMWYRRILKNYPGNEAARQGLMKSILPNSSEVGFEDASAIDRASFDKDFEAEHDRAVLLGRDGKYDESLALLEVLLFQSEWTPAILHDYLVILTWAREYALVLEHAIKIDMETAPARVLDAIAFSARELERYAFAQKVYSHMKQRFPDNLDALIGLQLCTAEAGDPQGALQVLLALAPDHITEARLLEAIGFVYDLNDDTAMARMWYRKLLELNPQHKAARSVFDLGRDCQNKTLEQCTGFSLYQLEAIYDDMDYASSLARDDRAPEAVMELECLLDLTGEAPAIFFDYLLFLQWAERDRDVLQYLDRLDPQTAPFHAVNAIANAARHEGLFELARDLYILILRREPENIIALTGVQICHAELGENLEQPIFALKALLRKHPRNLDVMAALAYIYSLDENQNKELEYYQLMVANSNQDGALRALRAANLSLDSLIPEGQAHADLLEQADARKAFFNEEHEAAIQLARDGQFEPALQSLSCLLQHPDRPDRVLEDYIVVLSWAGRDREALAFMGRVDPYITPSYVLEALARSARNTKDFNLGAALYEVILQRMPTHVNSQIGLQMCRAHTGDKAGAYKSLFRVLQDNPNHPSLLYTLLDLAVEQRNYFAQISIYQRILENDPDNPDAKQGLALATSRMGSPDLALEMLEKASDINLTPAMLEQILGDRAARRVIWGRMDQETIADRYVETDLSLQMLQDNLAANEPFGEKRLGEILRTQWDRLAALRDRTLMEACVELFESLEQWHDRAPAYALAAAGDAYIHQKKPKVALSLYRKALAKAPGMFTARLNLYYAHLESEDNDTAIDHINEMAASEPPWFRLPGSRVKGKNDAKLAADLNSFLAQSYVDRHHRAQPKLEEWLSRGPFNEAIRLALAKVYLWRGWAERALKHYDMILSYSPENLGAQLWRTYALMDLGRFREAELVVENLLDIYPEKPEVQKLVRDWEAHDGFRFHSEGILSKGTGENQGTDELTFDTWLFGPSVGAWLKPFAHHYYASATFFDGPVLYRRIGAGVQYNRKAVTARLETHADDLDWENPGFTVDLAYRLNDYWRVSGLYNSYSNQLPLKGRLIGLQGSETGINVDWRKSDRTSIGGSLGQMQFSDGNTRKTVLISGFQTLYSGPRYRLFSNLGAYNGRNDGGARIYFNPIEESSVDFSLDQYFLHHRYYERKFNHRLVLGYGYYDQKNYEGDWTGTFRYEHHWDIHDRLGFLYGYSRTRRVYDGAAEYASNYYTTIEWRF